MWLEMPLTMTEDSSAFLVLFWFKSQNYFPLLSSCFSPACCTVHYGRMSHCPRQPGLLGQQWLIMAVRMPTLCISALLEHCFHENCQNRSSQDISSSSDTGYDCAIRMAHFQCLIYALWTQLCSLSCGHLLLSP